MDEEEVGMILLSVEEGEGEYFRVGGGGSANTGRVDAIWGYCCGGSRM